MKAASRSQCLARSSAFMALSSARGPTERTAAFSEARSLAAIAPASLLTSVLCEATSTCLKLPFSV